MPRKASKHDPDADPPFSYWAIGAVAVLALAFFFWITRDTDILRPVVALRPPVATLTRSINVWAWGTPVEKAAWQRILADYEKEAGEVIQLQWWDSPSAYLAAREQACAQGRGPDVFLTDAGEIGGLSDSSRLLVHKMTFEEAANWLAPVLAPFRRDQTLLAYPSDFSLPLLYYNKKAFGEAGIAFPHDQWTWDILLSMGRALYIPGASPTETPRQWGLEMALDNQIWQTFSAQAAAPSPGTDWLMAITTKDTGASKSLTYLADFFQLYAFVSPLPMNSPLCAFEQGRSAMLIAGPEFLLRLPLHPGLEWGMAPLPRGERRAVALRIHAWAVSSNTRRPDLSAHIARALARKPSRSDWLSAYKPEVPLDENSPTALFYDQLRLADPPPALPMAPAMLRIVDEELAGIADRRRATPDAVLNRIASRLEPLALMKFTPLPAPVETEKPARKGFEPVKLQ